MFEAAPEVLEDTTLPSAVCNDWCEGGGSKAAQRWMEEDGAIGQEGSEWRWQRDGEME